MNPRIVNSGFTPLSRFGGSTGLWRRTGFLPWVYELTMEDQPVARLRPMGGRFIVRGSELTTAEGAWELVRPSFWSPQIQVRRAGEEAPIATWEPRTWWGLVFTGSGTLQFDAGPRFAWRVLDWWRGRHRFEGANDAPLVTVRPRWLNRGIELEIAPEAAEVAELPILAGLALHLALAAGRRRAR